MRPTIIIVVKESPGARACATGALEESGNVINTEFDGFLQA
jgi:hypothetical protein